MAIINFYTKDESSKEYDLKIIDCDCTATWWIIENIKKGDNFAVYEGSLSRDKEISRDFKRVNQAKEVSIFVLPASGIEIAYVVAAVFAVVALTVKPVVMSNLNRTQQSPNNSLSDRNNVARPLERIVDLCGTDKMIPDVLSREYSRFVDNIEQRVGYYAVARGDLLIEDIKDGDTLISDTKDGAAGVYGPFKSPNNSTPDIQVGELINEPVYGVTQSPDAVGQTLLADNVNTVKLEGVFFANSLGEIFENNDTVDFTENYQVGDNVNIVDVFVDIDDGAGGEGGFTTYRIGQLTHIITAVEKSKLTFNITGDPSWEVLSTSGNSLNSGSDPKIEQLEDVLIGPFKMTAFKVNKLLVNINALNGVYRENQNGRSAATVEYIINYQKLDDFGNTVGALIPVTGLLTGRTSIQKGNTTEIDLGGETFVQWSVQRTTKLDFDYNGTVVDEIKIKSVFGLFDIADDHFGNVTTIQTRRTNAFLTTATKTPELNCIATELVQKYEGNGVFATELTPNTQAVQSLIRLALDPFVGRRTESELDLDLLLSLQSENETYFDSIRAGQFNYSFDSTSLSAQETFMAIAKAAFITLWREGRVLKGWFESPQIIPSMVFTHRSKQPNSETWNRKRNTVDSKDSIEFTYTDDIQYQKETLFYPEDRSGKNPERVELTGVKGEDQARWHMMRLFNKNKYQEITVDFGATQEGRFVKPQSLISVVKGSRVYTYDGYIVAVDGLLVTLSQNVVFTPNDGHSIVLKRRDGSTESILVFETEFKNIVKMIELPTETIYTGNDELKTEFSFGNEDRLSAQLMLSQEIAPDGDSYVKIKAINYSSLYYSSDTTQTERAFDSGFDEGFL